MSGETTRTDRAERPTDAPAEMLAGLLSGIPCWEEATSALDRVFHQPSPHLRFLLVESDLPTLSRRLPSLEFPGIEGVDAAFTLNGVRWWLNLHEPKHIGADATQLPALRRRKGPLAARWDIHARRILSGVSRSRLREPSWLPQPFDPDDVPLAAIFGARFHSGLASIYPPTITALREPLEAARGVFSLVISGRYAATGLELLRRSGWIAAWLPDLLAMVGTPQGKEEHPEGDVWDHSLATLGHRKDPDLVLGLALLLHDCGKPFSPRTREHRFDGHAETGAHLARRVLEGLGYSADLVNRVCWLVLNHMMPPAMSELPISRLEPLMEDELFPALLELFRCDLVSTFRDAAPYFEACRRYRSWLRAKGNPWLTVDRQRLIRRYVAGPSGR